MFSSLVLKEIKYQFRSITFYLFFLILILFYVTQFYGDIGGPNVSLAPTPPEELKNSNLIGYSNYGTKTITDENQKMAIMYTRLLGDAESGDILKHGSFINKIVNLSDEHIKVMEEAAIKISKEGYKNGVFHPDVSYKEFNTILNQVDEELGGGTYFGEKYRDYMLTTPKTYEEALEDFRITLEKDKITNAYGRLFSDYMGITAGLFPIFLSAFLLTRDKRYKMHELIYSRQISSFKYVVAKYLGVFISVIICYLVLAGHATYLFTKIASINSYSIDYLAFFKYTIVWVAPTVLFTLAVGLLISILFNNGIPAVPLQFGLWISSMMPLSGDYSLRKFIVRFNSAGEYGKYMEWKPDIVNNRIFFVVVSLAILLIGAWVFEKKRGHQDGYFKKKSKSSSI